MKHSPVSMFSKHCSLSPSDWSNKELDGLELGRRVKAGRPGPGERSQGRGVATGTQMKKEELG